MKRVALLVSTILPLVMNGQERTLNAAPVYRGENTNSVSLALVPPARLTDQVVLEVRAAIRGSENRQEAMVSFYLDRETPKGLLHRERVVVTAGTPASVRFRLLTKGQEGHHNIIVVAEMGSKRWKSKQAIQIVRSPCRSPGTIDGAWINFSHFSEKEGERWLKELHKMTEADWREHVRDMHEIGMDTVVIHEVFRSKPSQGQHTMSTTGYSGRAFYPSKLYAAHTDITSRDPVEAVLSEADGLEMHVFIGVGMYAGFDYSLGSLEWHKRVASELWERYGHHRSFYGWYVPETARGDLRPLRGGDTERYRQEIIDFFREFQQHCRTLAPEKPVMLTPNAYDVAGSEEYWRQLLPYLDIVCPFAFTRPGGVRGEIPGERTAHLFRKLCDETGTHLWLDMESFIFDADGALIPRSMGEIADELRRYSEFDKILTYAYTGLFNAPDAARRPGGEATVKLFRDYSEYRKLGGKK